jgi:hypothetical protein
MIKLAMKYFYTIFFLSISLASSAQFYALGGYEIAFLNQKETNRILSEFNVREGHNLNDFRTLSGYRFGFGKYGRFTNLQISVGNVFKKQLSKNPSILRETAEVIVNTFSLDASLAYRPLKSEFFSIGGALHFGQLRYRYSFGGDYRVPLAQYGIWAEIFGDLAFKFRFLLKKESRDEQFYVFKISPFYRVYNSYDLQKFQRDFNNDNSVLAGERMQSLNNFGLRISLVVPFLNQSEKDYYKKGGKLDQEKLKKKMERMEKQAPKF